jgi:hypothetical protein
MNTPVAIALKSTSRNVESVRVKPELEQWQLF